MNQSSQWWEKINKPLVNNETVEATILGYYAAYQTMSVRVKIIQITFFHSPIPKTTTFPTWMAIWFEFTWV